jgi:hypothetical protein
MDTDSTGNLMNFCVQDATTKAEVFGMLTACPANRSIERNKHILHSIFLVCRDVEKPTLSQKQRPGLMHRLFVVSKPRNEYAW